MPATDNFPTYSSKLDMPAEGGFAVTPHATNELAEVTRALYVGTGGTLVVVTPGGTTLTLKNVANGSVLPVRARAVRDTSTCSDIVGLV